MSHPNPSYDPMDEIERINLKRLEETLRKDGWTFNATDYILMAVKEQMKSDFGGRRTGRCVRPYYIGGDPS